MQFWAQGQRRCSWIVSSDRARGARNYLDQGLNRVGVHIQPEGVHRLLQLVAAHRAITVGVEARDRLSDLVARRGFLETSSSVHGQQRRLVLARLSFIPRLAQMKDASAPSQKELTPFLTNVRSSFSRRNSRRSSPDSFPFSGDTPTA